MKTATAFLVDIYRLDITNLRITLPGVLVLPLAMCLTNIACAQSDTDRTGATLAEFQSVELVHFVDSRNQFSIDFPYRWVEGENPLGKSVIYVAGTYRQPSLSVEVRDRPEGLALDQSIPAIVAAFPGSPQPTDVKQRTINGHDAYEARVQWVYPIYEGFEIETRIVSMFAGNTWYFTLGSDVRTEDGFSADLLAAQDSFRLVSPQFYSRPSRSPALLLQHNLSISWRSEIPHTTLRKTKQLMRA